MNCRTRSPILVAALLVLACGCATDSGKTHDTVHPASPTPANPTSVTGTDWVLTRLGGEAAMPAEVSARPWFRLDPSDKRRVTGNTGVNLCNGTYELTGRALQFGPMISTRRAGSPELMSQELAFLKALEKTATVDLAGRTLTLRDGNQAPLAEFEAMEIRR
jgi:heat shock protein HslJ